MHHFRYIELNVQFHDGYRRYDNDLTQILWNRPRRIVEDIKNRWQKDIDPECVRMSSPGIFGVTSKEGDECYEVRYGDEKSVPSASV